MRTEFEQWMLDIKHLANYSNELCNACYHTKKCLDIQSIPSSNVESINFRGQTINPECPSRPAFSNIALLSDPTISSLCNKMKKFPDLTDVGKGLTIFQTNSDEIIEELGKFYELFVIIPTFVDKVLHELNSLSKFKITFELYPELTMIWFDLFIGVIKLLLLASRIGPNKKTVVFLYSRAYQFKTKEQMEPRWSNILDFFNYTKTPIQFVQKKLNQVSSFVFKLLPSLESLIQQRVIPSKNVLKRRGMWKAIPELYGTVQTLTSPESCTKLHEICVLTYLIFPSDTPSTIDFFKSVLEYGYLISLHRDEVFSIQEELDLICKELPKLSKLKVFKPDIQFAFQSSWNLHRERRKFFNNELQTMFRLLSSRKGLDGILNIMDTLNVVKEEIYWYFKNFDKDLYGECKSGKKETKLIDLQIIDLIYHHKHLWNLIFMLKNDILESLMKQVSPIIQQVSIEIKKLLESSHLLLENSQIESLESILECIEIKQYYPIQTHWLVFQMLMLRADTQLKIQSIVKLFNQILKSLDLLNHFEHILSNHATLKELYYFQPILFQHLKICIEENDPSSRYLYGLGLISSDFNDNMTLTWPAEGDDITNHSICYATEMFSIIGQYAAILVNSLAMSTIQLERLQNTTEKVGESDEKDQRKTIFKPQNTVGTDNIIKSMESLITSIESDKGMIQILLQTSNYLGIQLQDVEFNPFEFFIDSLCTQFRTFLNREVYELDIIVSKEYLINEDDIMSFDIKRPTVFLNEIKQYFNSIMFCNHITGINLIGLLRDVWADCIDLEKIKRYSSSMENELVYNIKRKVPRDAKGKSCQYSPNQPFLITLVQWYTEFLASKSHTNTTMFSYSQQCYCTIHNSSIQAELYTDVHEMKALCELIGLQGLQFMDEKLTRMVTILTGTVHEILHINQHVLDDIRQSLMDNILVRNLIESLAYKSEFVTSAKSIGFILHFRQLLHQAISKVFENQFTEIDSLVNVILKSEGDIQAAKILANQIGKIDKSDGMLQWALSALTADKKDIQTWLNLPLLFAIGFWQLSQMEQSIYNTQLDGLENNGHCLSIAFSKILSPIYRLLSFEKFQSKSLDEFWKLSGILLIPDWSVQLERQSQLKSNQIDKVNSKLMIVSIHSIFLTLLKVMLTIHFYSLILVYSKGFRIDY
ncbi:Nck-associated protein 1 [Globomyces pollinis-pini]|nr:Nck-associated protein 1 [Globomyces pollinis-pini]